jgi:predicted dehydrogenase
MEAIELIRKGEIGDLFQARAVCFKRRPSIGTKPDGPVPPGVDWDRFLGPAPMRPFNPNRFTYNWHWFWDTGNGDIGNQGVHQMDIALWGMAAGMPKWASSTGGKFAYNDQQETPNTQWASLGYDNAELVFEVRGLFTDGDGALEKRGKNCIGNVFYGTEGFLVLDDAGYQVYKGENNEKTHDVKASRDSDTSTHMENFAKAMRSRNHKELNAEVEIGVLAADLCHLANIAYRVGRRINWDPAKQKFVNDPEADKLITRDYRKPYVVPDKV